MKSIEYADRRWNITTGCENHENGICEVARDDPFNCWAYGMANRLKGRYGYPREGFFEPMFWPERLDEPLKRKKPTRYVVSFMGDIAFAEYEWIDKIIDVIKKCDRHRFIFCTKYPQNLLGFEFPDNCWVGVSVGNNKVLHRISCLRDLRCKNRWVSFEPLYEDLYYSDLVKRIGDDIDWFVIGAKTGRNSFQPSKYSIRNLSSWALDHDIPVFMKDNIKGMPLIQELPESLCF